MKSNLTMLPTSKLRSTEYQKSINNTQVSYIVSNFDVRLFDPIIVSKRRDGFYYVIDGQHRLQACKRMKKKEIPCFIVDATSKEEEAKLFRLINCKSAKRAANPCDDYNAALIAEDVETTAINTIISRWMFKVNSHKEDNCICAVSTLRWIYKHFGEQLLNVEMEILRKAYNGISVSLQSNFLKGLAYFLDANKKNKYFDLSCFIQKLKQSDPQNILRELNGRTRISLDFLAVNLFTNIYNYHKKTNRI